jgi:hypothetical protein|tara:strand:+ start:156 stop:536 length:381 start_codon:yes stop_codon:yes gene_type:complete
MATKIKPYRSEVATRIPSASNMEVGELAMNVQDGKFYTKTSVGQIKELGGAGSITLQDVTANGSITDRTITMNGANFIFEGNLEDAFETTLTVDEPTADNTLKLPNASGTLGTQDDALAYSVVFGS